MRRRTFLAGAATAAAPVLAGCSPCGETWPSVAFDVTPTALARRADGWRVDADVSVSFNFGTDGAGVRGAALAAFADDGRLLDATELGDLLWADVPSDEREEDDCGSWGTLRRSASVSSSAFPRWLGLRFDRATDAIDQPHAVARFPSETPGEGASAADYEPVPLPVDPTRPRTNPGDPVSNVRFQRRGDSCGDAGAEVRFERGVDVRWHRDLPAPRYHPVLTDVTVRDDRVAIDVGLSAWPRFRRLRCNRQGYRASVSVESTTSESIERAVVRHLDPTGEPVTSRSFRRATEHTPTGRGDGAGG